MSYNISPHQGKPSQPQSQHSAHSRVQQPGHYQREDYQRRSAYQGRQARPGQSPSPSAHPPNHPHDHNKPGMAGRPTVTPPPSQTGHNPIQPNVGQVVGQPQLVYQRSQLYYPRSSGQVRMPQRASSPSVNYNPGQIMPNQPPPPFIQPVIQQHGINLQYRQQTFQAQFPQAMAYPPAPPQQFYPANPNLQQASYIPNQAMTQTPPPVQVYQQQQPPQTRTQQQQHGYPKSTRSRKIITIVDPETQEDVTESIIGESSRSSIPPQSSLSAAPSTPPMNTATPPPQSGQFDPNHAIQAQFAAEVARRAMAPEEEHRREEPQATVVIPKTILPRQEPKPVTPSSIENAAPATVPQQVPVQKLEAPTVDQSESIAAEPTPPVEKSAEVLPVISKEVPTESAAPTKEPTQDIPTPDVTSAAPSTESQPGPTPPPTITPDTDASDSSQVKESKKKNQKKRIQELDRKPAKDDDMFSAYRTEEDQQENESTQVEPETESLSETSEQVEETLTNSNTEIETVTENTCVEKSSEDEIVNATLDRTKTNLTNDNIVDKNNVLEEKATQNEVNEFDDLERNVLQPTELEQEKEVSKNDLPITDNEVSMTDKDLSTTEKVIDSDEKENTAPTTNSINENSQVNEEDTKPTVKDNKIELKYKYREDQWSPINLEGKRQYDREFLMQFKDNCREKPDGLPKIPDVVLDTANIGSLLHLDTKASKPVDFMPMYLKSPNIRGQPPNFNARNSNKGGRVITARKVINSKSSEVELKKSDNAWKPGIAASTPEKEAQTQEVYRKFKGILNKLAPQKFQKLTNQALELQINTEERLKGVIDLVFEKALSEPNFSVAYAHMCRMLSQIEVPLADKKGQLVQFRKLLLNRCQREFESETQDENLLREKRKEIDLLPENERESKKEEFELEVIAAKQRALGNVKFIGELFKIKMLTEQIMHSCVMQLLKAADDESLECMSKLLSTIGKELDHDKAKFRMDQYFQQIVKIIKSKKNSNRIRFMLQDVVELRENNWVPRREDNKPKTIDQIHQEAREEEVMKKVEAEQAQIAARRASRGRNERGVPPIEDGEWNVVTQRGSAGRPQQVDPNKFKVTKQAVDDNVQLGPGGRPGSFGGWGRGASGGTKPSSSSQERPSSPAANRFSALSEDRRLGPGGRSLATSRDRDRDRRGSQTKRGSRERDDRQSRDKDKQAVIDQVRRMSASQERMKAPAKVVEPAPAQPTSNELSEEVMKKKSKAIIEEFMHLKDRKEALECVKELQSPNQMHLFTFVAIEETLERTEQARNVVGGLLSELITCKLMSISRYNQGFKDILEFAEDMAIDIPLIWTYLAQIISPAISGGSTNLKNLIPLLEPVKSIGKSGQILAEVLKSQAKEIGATVIAGQWAASGLQLKQFLNPNEDVQEFIERRELGFLLSAPSTSSSMNLGKMQAEVKYILKEQNADNEAVFQWIDRHFTKQRTEENDFIRALTTVVCESAINGEGPASRGDSDVLKRRAPLLQKYIDSKETRELQALYAVQSLNNSLANPPGLLRILFDVLYDEDVICEETFYSWQDCNDAREAEGKGVALKSVTSFFTWLCEAEPDDAPDN